MASIRKRQWRTASGKHRVAWIVDFDAAGARDRRQFASRKAADAFRIKIEGQLNAGAYRALATRITVGELADQFLAHCEGRMLRGERMSRHNYNVYEGHIRNYICPDPDRHADRTPSSRLRPFARGIEAIRLADLTPSQVGDFRDRLREAGVSLPTTRKILATLKVMLGYAVSRDLVAANAGLKVTVIGRRDEGSVKIIPPSKALMRRLIEAASESFRSHLIVASATGLRAGEFHALRWRHIDFGQGEVTVETRVDAYRAEDVTKTAAGMRRIPLGAPVLAALEGWRRRTPFPKADDLIFPSKRGTYAGHDNMVKRQFKPLFDKLEVEDQSRFGRDVEPIERFNWHALRHFAISCWIEAGLDPKTVQTFAGHSSLQVTMDRYGHLFRSEGHRKAMDAIAGAMFSPDPDPPRSTPLPKKRSRNQFPEPT